MNKKNKAKWKRIVGCVSAIAMLLSSIPVNTLVASAEGETEPTYVNVLDNENISLHGVTYGEAEQAFIRMDSETAAGIANTESLYDEDGAWVNTVYSLAREAAGGRIRFQTNSTYVAIKATLTIHDASHLSHGGKMEAAKYGFDVYVDSAEGSVYAGTVCGEAPTKNPDGSLSTTEVLVEGTVNLGEAADRDLTIYFPITSETKSLEIGVAEGSTIAPHETDYTEGKHLVFYGSSITQGGAVTKPGNTYVNTVGRNMNMEYTNFGMWGRCKGEPAFANYIAGLGNISAFVYDFDHNISKVSLMEPVHYPFYETVRAAYPDIPIIMITRPGNNLDNTAATDPSYSTTAEMKEVIYKSYQKAVAAGDENVHFIDGESFFGYSTTYMADGSHPNDAGQARMAEVVTSVLQRAFAGEKNVVVTPGCDQLAYNYDFEDDAKAEDGEDNSGATDWSVNLLTEEKYTVNPLIDVIEEDGNNALRIQYQRGGSASIYNGVISDTSLLSGTSDFTIEMKTKAYKDTTNNKWGYAALSIIDSESDNNRFDIRIVPNGEGCQVLFYDRSNNTNVQKYAVGLDSAFEFEDLSNYYNETKTEFTYNLKVEVETADITSGVGEDFICRVYVGYQDTEGQEPVWQEPVVFKTDLEKTGFNPEKLGLFALVGSGTPTARVEVDDIKVYQPGQHTINAVAEVPVTTEEAGKDAHYVCSSCGQLYLDANGILKTTDEELTHAKLVPCATLYTNYGVAPHTVDDFALGTDASVTNVDEAWQITSAHGKYVIVEDHTDAENVNTLIMGTNNNFGFKMDTTLYRDNNNNWTYTRVMFRKANGTGGGHYAIQLKPTEDGYRVYLMQDGTQVDYASVKDKEKFASAYAEGTSISYKIRIVAVFNEDSTEAKFCIYVDNHDVLVLQPTEPITSWKATSVRIYLYSATGSTGLKAVVDNIEVYKTEHTTSYVAEVPATETTTGTKAHHKCSVCDQKFLDEACTIVVADEELTIPTRTFCVDLCEAFDVDLDSLDGWNPSGSCSESQGDDGLVFAYSGTGSSAYFSAATAYLDKNTDFSFKTTATIYKDDSGDWSYMGIFFRNGGNNQGPELRLIPNETGYELMLCDRTTKSVGSTYTKTVEDDNFAALFAEGTKISYNLHVIMDANDDNSEVKFHVWVDDNAVETFEFVPDVTGVNPPTATRIFLYSTGGGVGHKVAINNTVAYKTTHDTITAVEAVASTDTVAGVKAHYKCSDCEKKFMDEEATVVATDAALEYWKLSDVLCQTRENKTNPSNTDVRFVFYVDDYTKYSGVKFTITCGDKSNSAITKNVYQKVYAGNKLYATQDLYGVTNGYFTTFILSNCNDALLAQGMTVKVTLICTDGTEIPYNESTKTFPQ